MKSIPISEWGQPDGSIAQLLLKQNPVCFLFRRLRQSNIRTPGGLFVELSKSAPKSIALVNNGFRRACLPELYTAVRNESFNTTMKRCIEESNELHI